MAGEVVDSVEMLRRLVAFDTTSRNSNLALIEYVQEYLKGHGVGSKLVPSEDGKKANLFATVGPMAKRTQCGGSSRMIAPCGACTTTRRPCGPGR